MGQGRDMEDMEAMAGIIAERIVVMNNLHRPVVRHLIGRLYTIAITAPRSPRSSDRLQHTYALAPPTGRGNWRDAVLTLITRVTTTVPDLNH